MKSKILVFDLIGKWAHFRDISTNSSAFTYPFPPRTTVIGLLGSMLGEKGYADLFSDKDSKIAVEVLGKHRKMFMTIKYKKIQDFKIKNSPTLNPIQFIRGTGTGMVKFRVYLTHSNSELLAEIARRIENKLFVFPISLGAANMGCRIEMVGMFDDYEEKQENGIVVVTVVPKSMIGKLNFFKDNQENRKYEKVQAQRIMNKHRDLLEVREYIVPVNGNGIYLEECAEPYICVNMNGRQTNIAWL